MGDIRVLIADDNWEFAKLLSDVIVLEGGFKVVNLSKNGKEALENIVKYKPDIVILDLIMPEIDGLEVLERLKLIEDLNIKILMLSAMGQDEITKQAIDLGVDYYMLKPFDFSTFMKRLKELASSKEKSEIINLRNKNIEYTIIKIFRKIGLPANLKGYIYLKEAISIAYKDEKSITSITKNIYKPIADNNNTTVSRVERAIRNAIYIAWERGNMDEIQKIFRDIKYKPTNSEFIAIILETIELNIQL